MLDQFPNKARVTYTFDGPDVLKGIYRKTGIPDTKGRFVRVYTPTLKTTEVLQK